MLCDKVSDVSEVDQVAQLVAEENVEELDFN